MFKIYVNQVWMWIHVSSFVNRKTVNDNFPIFHDFEYKLANFAVISREIAKIMGIGREQIFTFYNWSEMWLCEILKIAFKSEFSVNVNSLTHL